MLIFENIALALAGLKANKSRSILTMLGIIIGIAAVISIMTIGSSMSKAMSSELSGFGANRITMGVSERSNKRQGMGGGMEFRGPRRQISDDDLIKDEMIDQLLQDFKGKVSTVGLTENVGNATVRDGKNYAYVSIVGSNNGDLEKSDLDMLAGRQFLAKDYKEARKVCLVSDKYVNNLYGGDVNAALGQTAVAVMNKRYYKYTIVGVYEYDSSEAMFSSASEEDTVTTLYLPIQTAREQTHSSNGYGSITVIAEDGVNATTLTDEITEYMNAKFYRNNENYKVTGFSMQSIIEEMESLMATMSLAISLIAGISLLVGGIGVMNIMLVSITERTKEIGTRKALGATNNSIRMQFIVESIVLCVVGGLIGIVLGIIIGMAASKLMQYPGSISIPSIIISVGFSAAIGIFFGYYPANKAAKMNPIDALRYE